MAFELDAAHIASENRKTIEWLEEDYEHLGRQLARRGIDVETLTQRAMAFRVAVPSWGVGTGGTRFARFPGPGEPRNVFEKIEDCEVIFKLVRSTTGVSLHIPWDQPDSPAELRSFAEARGLFFDSMNSNTFEDQPDQPLSYKFGSLSHTDPAVRGQAVEHNLRLPGAGSEAGRALPHGLDRRRRQLPGPGPLPRRARALPGQRPRDLSRPARRLAPVHRAQALRARLLLDGHRRLGHELPLRPRARRAGVLPGRPGASRAQREHRDDRGAAHPVREARAASTSTTASTATTTSTPAPSSPSSSSSSSTSWSTPSWNGCRASTPPTCWTSRTT